MEPKTGKRMVSKDGWTCLRKRQVQFRRPVLNTVAAFIICLACGTPLVAQKEVSIPGEERTRIAEMLATGTTTLHVRATAIHDALLVSAIQKGARTRRIYVLLDQPSAEIRALLGRPNVQVRLTRTQRRGKIGKEKQYLCTF